MTYSSPRYTGNWDFSKKPKANDRSREFQFSLDTHLAAKIAQVGSEKEIDAFVREILLNKNGYSESEITCLINHLVPFSVSMNCFIHLMFIGYVSTRLLIQLIKGGFVSQSHGEQQSSRYSLFVFAILSGRESLVYYLKECKVYQSTDDLHSICKILQKGGYHSNLESTLLIAFRDGFYKTLFTTYYDTLPLDSRRSFMEENEMVVNLLGSSFPTLIDCIDEQMNQYKLIIME